MEFGLGLTVELSIYMSAQHILKLKCCMSENYM